MKFGKKMDERGWQVWFAWRPVRLLTGQWAWLENVLRAEWGFGAPATDEIYKMGGPKALHYAYKPIEKREA